jgi:hypothetical protein
VSSIEPVCLTDPIRSQRFSRSQRLNPNTPLWPYFVPHPLVDFDNDLQSFFRTGQPWRFSAPAALLPLGPTVPTSRPGRRSHLLSDASQQAAPRTQNTLSPTTLSVTFCDAASHFAKPENAPAAPGFRALLRPGVRHSARRVNVTQSRCSLDLDPLRGIPG